MDKRKQDECAYAAAPPSPRTQAQLPFARRRNPLADASLLSQLAVQWFQPLVTLGAKRALEREDVWPISPEDSCDALEQRFWDVYEPHRAFPFGLSPVAVAFMKTFRREIVVISINYIVYMVAMALQSYIAQAILDFLNDRVNVFHVGNGYVLVFMMTAASLAAILSLNYGFFSSSRIGSNMRSLTMSLVYQKSLRLSCSSRQAYSTGEVLTLMSVDAERVFNCMMQGLWIFIAPFGLLMCIVLLGLLFDAVSAACGAVVIVIVLAISLRQADQIADVQTQLLTVVDERVRVTSEALQGIRVMKFYAWEESLARRIEKIRALEVKLFRKFHVYQISNTVMLFLTPVFISGITLGVYVIIHGSISVTDAYTLVAMVNICRAAVNVFPLAIASLSQARSAFSRLDTYLTSEEFQPRQSLIQDGNHEKIKGQRGSITVQDATFEWSDARPTESGSQDVVVVHASEHDLAGASPSGDYHAYSDVQGASATDQSRRISEASVRVAFPTASEAEMVPTKATEGVNRFSLQHVNTHIEPGSLIMIVGAVGSGKSSFLNALLGEMTLTTGRVDLEGEVSYVSQETWIRNSTVQENILFESTFDAMRYQQVLEASQLALDLGALPDGDQTEIGERGINLSGGQKARVAIARAVYRPTYDILLLDDPLSAVDPHVAHAIFEHCIVGLASEKTRLLVLNSHYDLLPRADRILVMHEGRLVGDGSYSQIIAEFPELQAVQKDLDKFEEDLVDEHESTAVEEKRAHEAAVSATVAVVESKDQGSSENDGNGGNRLIKEEDRVKGRVSMNTYKTYFDETGYHGIVVILAIIVAYSTSQAMRVLTDWWQGHWASNMPRKEYDPTYSATAFGMWYLAFIVLCTILTVARGLLVMESCIQSARHLHDELFRRVLRAPVNRYFDVTPVGRILNRFSNDLDQMDSILPQQYQITFQNLSMCISCLIVSAMASYWIGVSYIPAIAAFLLAGQYFNKTSREVKRLEGISRTPVFNLFGETLNGLPTIRAFNMQDRFVALSKKAVDENSVMYFTYWAASRWLAVRLDCLSVSIIFVVSVYIVATKGQLTPVIAGISLSYSLMLTSMMQSTVRAVDWTDNAMTSVERLLHFRDIPQETEAGSAVHSASPGMESSPSSWPALGSIHFDNLCLRYRPELPLVLRGVNMDIQAGEKVGICGRTGAGKSSLMIALFRICEYDSGTVLIDGVDLQSVKLRDLRRSLAIIPQDPVLFSGSLRENLDPYNDYSDAAIWDVLRKVHLADTVTQFNAGLEFSISERGENLSIGQRQLLCIGRALLKDSKIVVLDEATANVDSVTDHLIQETIKETFANKTVLIIAHRMNTIMHCDKIAVMDAGRVAEFAAPTELLARPESIFASLVAMSSGGIKAE